MNFVIASKFIGKSSQGKKPKLRMSEFQAVSYAILYGFKYWQIF